MSPPRPGVTQWKVPVLIAAIGIIGLMGSGYTGWATLSMRSLWQRIATHERLQAHPVAAVEIKAVKEDIAELKDGQKVIVETQRAVIRQLDRMEGKIDRNHNDPP